MVIFFYCQAQYDVICASKCLADRSSLISTARQKTTLPLLVECDLTLKTTSEPVQVPYLSLLDGDVYLMILSTFSLVVVSCQTFFRGFLKKQNKKNKSLLRADKFLRGVNTR